MNNEKIDELLGVADFTDFKTYEIICLFRSLQPEKLFLSNFYSSLDKAMSVLQDRGDNNNILKRI